MDNSGKGIEPGARDALGCVDASVSGGRVSLRYSAGSKVGEVKFGWGVSFSRVERRELGGFAGVGVRVEAMVVTVVFRSSSEVLIGR